MIVRNEGKKEKSEEQNPGRDPTIFGHKVLLVLCFLTLILCATGANDGQKKNDLCCM
jgi:hypothetical protein